MSVILSGGHTFISNSLELGKYNLLSTTIDDSIGETIDKVARMIGIDSVPGGPHLERLAKRSKYYKLDYEKKDVRELEKILDIQLPKPRIKKRPTDMSFSGIKSSVKRIIDMGKITDDMVNDFCCYFQMHIIKYVTSKIKLFVDKQEYSSIVVGGGVTSNEMMRFQLEKINSESKLCFPPPKYCVDNGVMVAWNGVEKIKMGLIDPPIPLISNNTITMDNSTNQYVNNVSLSKCDVESWAKWKLF
jgi:glycoprotease/Kae1 family metallohydrolase